MQIPPGMGTRQIAAVLVGVAAFAGTVRSASLTTATMDSGGQQATSARYTLDLTVGGPGGAGSSNAVGGVSMSAGFPGQLTELTGFAITVAPLTADEERSVQLGGIARFDDASTAILGGESVAWDLPTHPIASIDTAGVARAAAVFSNTLARIRGNYLGFTAGAVVVVRDSDPDNYGCYARDGVPDAWQGRHFGWENPDGMARANPDGDPFDNGQEFVADTHPRRADSCFTICAVSNGSASCSVHFASSTGRVYALQFRTNLTDGVWLTLPAVRGTGGRMPLCGGSSGSPGFYRVQVSLP